ncbi:MAG: uroporphyrinogen decarboxylase family protein [Candidatus Latescibacterota bacterium]
MKTLTSQERILAVLNHQEADRIPIQDHPWGTAVTRWHQEGLPEDQTPDDYFGFEMKEFGFDASLQLPQETVEDTDEYSLVRNSDGALVKSWKHVITTPGWVDFLIKDRGDWNTYKPRMTMNPTRVDWENELARCTEAREQGFWVRLVAATGYDRAQTLMGSERLLMAMIEDPDWAKDIFSTIAELVIHAAEEMMVRGFLFDSVIFCEDMGYRNALLFSPALYRQLVMPSDKRLCDFFRGKGMKVMLHSCGNVMELVPNLIEAGFDCLEPLEVKAGMDLVKLKKAYGNQLSFMGGIDVRKMADPNPEAIEEEIRTKVTIAKQGGGYIFHSDHSVPNDVSFEQYTRCMKLVQHYGKY